MMHRFLTIGHIYYEPVRQGTMELFQAISANQPKM